MKVFNKWIVYAFINGKKRMSAHFSTKKEAVERLNACFERECKNLWIDQFGQEFWIEKNKTEY